VFRDKKDMALFQTKHMTTIKKQYYGVSAGYLKQLSKNIIELFTNISVKWQKLIYISKEVIE